MTVKKLIITNKLSNSKGETLIELLISMFILSITLSVIISVFMTGRAGIVESWGRTGKDQCAASVMEQLKSLPYSTLETWKTNFDSSGGATNISISHLEVVDNLDQQCTDSFDVHFDLLKYKDYDTSNIIQVNVKVRTKDKEDWIEKASLIRKGDST